MKDVALQILGKLYEYKYNTEEYDYETVDEYYAYLGYNLELHHELRKLDIQGTSDLQEELMNREDKI